MPGNRANKTKTRGAVWRLVLGLMGACVAVLVFRTHARRRVSEVGERSGHSTLSAGGDGFGWSTRGLPKFNASESEAFEGAITGVAVEQETDLPVPGAYLRVIDQTSGRTLVSAQADARGHFRLRVPWGGFALRGVHDGRAGLLPSPVVVTPTHPTADVHLALHRAFDVYGVISTDGTPVANARMRLDDREITSDAAGHFRFVGVEKGFHWLLRVPERDSLSALMSSRDVVVDTTDVRVDLDVGHRFTLTIAVVSDAGAPVPNASVSATMTDQAGTMATTGCETNGAGTCSFSGLVEGAVTVGLTGQHDGEQTVVVPNTTIVRLATVALSSIDGTVMTRTGKPVGDRVVRLANDGESRIVSSRQDGTFRFFGLRPGDYTIEVRSSPVWTPDAEAATPLSLGAGENKPNVRLVVPDDDAVLSGSVITTTRAPVAGALVACNPALGARPVFTTSASDGTFTCFGLRASNRYEVSARDDAGGIAMTTKNAPNRDITLVLEKSAGFVLSLNTSVEVKDVRVYLRSSTEHRTILLEADGSNFSWLEATPGAYDLVITRADGEHETQVVLEPGATKRMSIDANNVKWIDQRSARAKFLGGAEL